MKTLLLFLAFFSFYEGKSQIKNIDYISYYNHIHEANYYFYEHEYDSALIYFERGLKFVSTPRPKDFYNYCRALWKTGHRKLPEYELMNSPFILDNQINGNDSTFFEGMTKETKNAIELNIKYNQSQLNNPHAYFIDSIMQEDQKVRQRTEDVPDSIFFSKMRIQDSSNQIVILNYSKKHGFPAGINGGWDQRIATILLHFSREWFIENYHFLVNEVKQGNLEPWMLSRAIDRTFIVNDSKATAPFNTYFGNEEPDPFIIFKNCSTIGLSPYYDFDHLVSFKSISDRRKQFYDIYKANKKVYNLTFF